MLLVSASSGLVPRRNGRDLCPVGKPRLRAPVQEPDKVAVARVACQSIGLLPLRRVWPYGGRDAYSGEKYDELAPSHATPSDLTNATRVSDVRCHTKANAALRCAEARDVSSGSTSALSSFEQASCLGLFLIQERTRGVPGQTKVIGFATPSQTAAISRGSPRSRRPS
jgi:hypothetical protein